MTCRTDHHRTFSALPVQIAEVEFTMQVRGADHADDIRAVLSRAGFPVREVCA